MDKQTAMCVTFVVTFLSAALSAILCMLLDGPEPYTVFESFALALLASIWIGVMWEDKNK